MGRRQTEGGSKDNRAVGVLQHTFPQQPVYFIHIKRSLVNCFSNPLPPPHDNDWYTSNVKRSRPRGSGWNVWTRMGIKASEVELKKGIEEDAADSYTKMKYSTKTWLINTVKLLSDIAVCDCFVPFFDVDSY